MDQPELECQDCFWQGDSLGLLSATDDDDDLDFIHCPDCNGTDICDYEEEPVTDNSNFR